MKGHNLMGNVHECILTGEVICRTTNKNRGNIDYGEEEQGSDTNFSNIAVQFGPIHRTERKRGTSPKFGNVFITSICCHELQKLENIEFEITMYQCHSWRPNSYIGSVTIYPSDVRLGQVVSFTVYYQSK